MSLKISLRLALTGGVMLLAYVALLTPKVHAAEADPAERMGEGDAAAGAAKAAPCQSCHGADGNAGGEGVPKLAAQFAAYQLKQLDRYDFGARKGHGAKLAPRDDYADIVAWFASQARQPAASPAVSAQAQAPAHTLFTQGDGARGIAPCASCHGSSGEGQAVGSDANPAIAGQPVAYLRTQLQGWKSGARNGSSSMTLMAAALSDEEIQALSTYVAALK